MLLGLRQERRPRHRASRWWRSAATAAPSWRRTPTSTWCSSTTRASTWASWPQTLWYPLWDSGARLDHSVRSLPEMLAAADADHRVASGLLDVRHVAGDPGLTLRLRTTMLAHWRRGARERLPEMRAASESRHRLMGELAHLSVPDLKEAEGGLRDATTLRGLVATWLVDVPHTELERSRQVLLDVRDLVHGIAGRATDRVAPEMWPELARALGPARARRPPRRARGPGARARRRAAGSPT